MYLKGVQAAVSDMICIGLRNQAIKILGLYFSNNKKIKDKKMFYYIISNIQGVLNFLENDKSCTRRENGYI